MRNRHEWSNRLPRMSVICAASCLLVGGLALSQSNPPGGSGLTFRDIAYASAPVNVSKPKISGVPNRGRTLKASHGSWTNAPTFYSYQWKRCNHSGANCKAIHNAIKQSHKLTAADVGHTIRVRVIAYNTGGSSHPATSKHTAVIKP